MQNEKLDTNMIHHTINFSPERRPHSGQIPRVVRHDLRVPDAFIDIGIHGGDVLDERPNSAEPGQGRCRRRERHAAGADAMLLEIDSRLAAYGCEEALGDGDYGGDFIGGCWEKTGLGLG